MISRSKPILLYKQVKQLLLSKIQDKTFKPGELLPTEKQLEDEHKFSRIRITVSRALNGLGAEGYVSRHAGRGTTVLQPKITHTAGRLGGFEDDLLAQTFTVKSHVLLHERRLPTAHAAYILKVTRD